jgi:hypothetical protein
MNFIRGPKFDEILAHV